MPERIVYNGTVNDPLAIQGLRHHALFNREDTADSLRIFYVRSSTTGEFQVANQLNVREYGEGVVQDTVVPRFQVFPEKFASIPDAMRAAADVIDRILNPSTGLDTADED